MNTNNFAFLGQKDINKKNTRDAAIQQGILAVPQTSIFFVPVK